MTVTQSMPTPLADALVSMTYFSAGIRLSHAQPRGIALCEVVPLRSASVERPRPWLTVRELALAHSSFRVLPAPAEHQPRPQASASRRPERSLSSMREDCSTTMSSSASAFSEKFARYSPASAGVPTAE